MKKKIVPLLLCLLLAIGSMLTGCGDSFSKIKVSGKQDYSYVVTSQGGMAVQYGNYVYFINGYAGYEDTDGKQNTWPNVVKGGLYRAELYGRKDGDTFAVAPNPQAVLEGMEFVVSQDADETDVVNVQKIAPKRIGTSGYKNGGIFIYDEWVYFATPNNEKNKSGTVQTTKTDFFRARLDGSKVQKIYTTEAASNESSAYAFYKYNGSVYLVAKDGSDVISVKTAKKIADKVTIAQNVTDVLLPYADTYYGGMNENTLNHFVYVLRAVGEDDSQKAGTVIEIMRPDGKEGGVYRSAGSSDTLEAVRDGMFFYRTTDSFNNAVIQYDNLHSFLMGYEQNGKKVYGDTAYAAYQNKLAGYVDEAGKFKADITEEQQTEYHKNARAALSGGIDLVISDYTATYCFRAGGETSDVVNMLGFTDSKVELWSSVGDIVTVYGSAATLKNVAGQYIYFTDGSTNDIYRTNWTVAAENKDEAEKVSGADVTDYLYNADYCAGYVVYVAKKNDLADSYTFFKNVDRADGVDPVFVGAVTSAEVLAAPKISLKDGVISWSAVTNAESYTVYCSVDGVASAVSEGVTETSFTATGAGDYWVVAKHGNATSAKSNIITYKG